MDIKDYLEITKKDQDRANAAIEEYENWKREKTSGSKYQSDLRSQCYAASGMDYFRKDFTTYVTAGVGLTDSDKIWEQNIKNQRDYFSRYAKYFTDAELRQFNGELDYYESIVKQRMENAGSQGNQEYPKYIRVDGSQTPLPSALLYGNRGEAFDISQYSEDAIAEHSGAILDKQNQLADSAKSRMDAAEKNVNDVDQVITTFLQNSEISFDENGNIVFKNDKDRAQYNRLLSQRQAYVNDYYQAQTDYNYSADVFNGTREIYMRKYDEARSLEEIDAELEAEEKGETEFTPLEKQALMVERGFAEDKNAKRIAENAKDYMKENGFGDIPRIESDMTATQTRLDEIDGRIGEIDKEIQNQDYLIESISNTDNLTEDDKLSIEAANQKKARLQREKDALLKEREAAAEENKNATEVYSYIWGSTFLQMQNDENFADKVAKGKKRYDAEYKAFQDEVTNDRAYKTTVALTPEENLYYELAPYYSAGRRNHPIAVDITMLSQEEQDNFYYLCAIGQDQLAVEYVQQIAMNDRRETLNEIADWAGTNTGTRLLATIGSVLLLPVSGSDMQLYGANMAWSGASGGIGIGATGDALIGGVAQGLTEKGFFNTGWGAGTIDEKVPIVGGIGLGDGYQLVMSMVNSFVSAQLFGSGATIMLGSKAASSAFNDAINKGASYEQAVEQGLAQGIAEALFEYISIDKLLNGDITAGTVKRVLQQAGVEASEEILTSIANSITDRAIMKDLSEFETTKREYMEQGYSEIEAEDMATRKMWEGIAFDGIGGLLSGGGMALMYSGTIAKQTEFQDYMGKWADAALQFDPSSDIYKEGAKMKALLKSGEQISKEYMQGIYDRIGKEGFSQVSAKVNMAEAVEKVKGRIGDIDQQFFNPETAVTDVYDTIDAYKEVANAAIQEKNASKLLVTTANAVKMLEAAQTNLDNALEQNLLDQNAYSDMRQIVEEARSRAQEILDLYMNQKGTVGTEGLRTEMQPVKEQEEENSVGAQAYLDAGASEAEAFSAGEILDGILRGEITSESISNSQIGRLLANEEYGRNALSAALGVEVTREATASKQRSAVKAAIAQYEASAAQRKNTAAGATQQENITSEGVTTNETETAGKQSVRGDEGRQGDLDSGEQAGIVGESGSQRTADIGGTGNLTEAERKSLRKRKLNRQIERFDEVTAYKNASEVLGSEKYEGDIAEIPEELYTEEMKEAAEKLAKDGIRVRYFKGTLMSETHDGRMRRTPGLFRAGTNEVWASVSSARFSPEQIAMHEYYHALVYRGVANVEQTVQEIREKFSPEEFERIVEQYLEDYRGAYEGNKIEDIYEELLADAYAGMNRFAKEKSAVQYQDVVRDQIQRGRSENERATRDTRGAPERKYSYDETESEEEYRMPITQQDITTIRSIGRKSINEFSSDDIQKTKKWAYKFFQELGVKSPFFRAWFGDWRANDTKTKVKFVPVNAESIERSDIPRGIFFNKDTQWSIKSNSDGIDETTSKSGKWSDDYHALSDIDKMLENAVLLDTVVVNRPSKRLGENAAFMHHLYCPIYVNGETGLAKIYVAETFGNDHKFYLLKIEKASSDMGFNYVSEVFTPDSEAASEDALVSVADIFSFVKNHDGNFEANSAYPVHFSPRKANPIFLNEDGTPKVFYHGSKKNGGFTVFRDWQYFTEQKQYAERYAERGNQKSLYEVYLTAGKVFDTRNKDAARIFESIRQEYGLTELQDTGLPDWTDGYDITEYLSEHPELGYDAVLLDEGGDLVNGEPVSRGLSIVIKDSSQVKSATDNIGTFDRSNKDIRYSFDDEDYMLAVEAGDMEAAQKMVDEAAKAAVNQNHVNSYLLNEDGTPMKVYRGRNGDYTVFDKRMIRKRDDGIEGFFFSPPARRESVAAYYGDGKTDAFYLSLKNPLVVTTDERIDASRAREYDGIIRLAARDFSSQYYNYSSDTVETESLKKGDIVEIVAFYPEQIKSADPVTYDDNGNVIPISERFKSEKTDIRYSFEEDVEALDEDYMLAVEAGDMDAAQQMVDEAAKAAGYDTDGTIEFGEFVGSENRSYRGVMHGESPVSEWGTMMFTDDAYRAYWSGELNDIQKQLYSVQKSDLTDIETMKPVIQEKLNEDIQSGDIIEIFGLDYVDFDSVTVEELYEYFNPQDIVDNAEAYDNNEMIKWLWDRVLEPMGIQGVKTRNGAVVFEGSGLVQRVANTSEVVYDDDGKVVPISERFSNDDTQVKFSFEEDVEALDEEYRQVMDSEPVPHRTAGDLKREIRDTIARGSRQEQAPEPTATVTRTVPAGEFYPEGTTVTHTYGRGKPFYSKTTNLSPKEALFYLQAATGMKWRVEPMRKGLWKAVMTGEKLDTVYAPPGYNKAVKELRTADKNAQVPTVKEFAEQKLAEGWRDPNAPTAATVHAEGIKKSDFTASKALNKIGVKIDGSVTDYSITQNMRSAEEARRRIVREIYKAERYWDATQVEKDKAVDIANGDKSYFDIPPTCRFNVVSELAALRMDERMAGNNLVQQRRYAIRDSLLEKAMDMFPNAEEIEKNPSLFHPLALRRMNFRTAQRNMLSIFGDELGAELYEYYFAPVTRNEASRQRWMNEQFDKVRKFEGSDGKTKKLTRAESAYVHELLDLEGYVQKVNESEKKDDIIEAAQELGDQKNAEENTIRDMAVKYDLDKEQTSWMVKYAQWIAMQEGYSSKVDVERCKAAAAVYRQLFDDYFEAINDFLVAHGAIPINKIEGYTPHMTTNDKVNLLSNALETLGFNANATRLPAEIAGRTEEFRPSRRWTPFFEHRTGDKTDYDIVKGFESYVTYISDVLFHMDDIQKIRSAEEYLRQGVSGTFETSIQEAIDMSRSGNTEDRIDYLKKLGRIRDAEYGDFSKKEINEAFDTLIKEMIGERKENTRYSDMVMWLQNYANVLAGKQYGGDRGEEHEGGRGALTLGNKINALFARANVAGNLSSALNQMAQLPTLLSERRATSVAHALGELTTGKLREFAMESDFLTSKKGVNYITRSVGEMTLEGLFKPTEFMDSMLSTIVVRSAYLDAVKDGMSHEAAMRFADNYGQKIMADRSKGAKPLTFYNKGLIKQALRMFQIEALNSWEHIFLDLPRDFRQIARDKGKASAARAVALVIVKYLIAAFVLNRWTEEEYGGTPAPFDLFGMTANFIASGNGLTTNEWIKRTINKVTGVDIFEESNYEEFEKFDWGAAVEDTTYNLSNEIPFASNVAGLFGVGDRTIPTVLPGIIKAGKGIYDAANENGVFSDDTALALVELLKSAVPGGRQIGKTVEGIRAAIEGGKMNGTGENERLQYVTDDSVLGIIQQVLFGVNATEESRAHYASGESGLTARQTQMWKEITEQGGDGTELFELIQGYRKIGNDDSLTSAERTEQQRNAIAGSSFTDDQKAYIYSVLFGDKDGTAQDEPFGELMDAGMSWDAITEMFNEYKRIYNDDSLGASEQTTEFQYWIDKQKYTKKQREIINDSFRYGRYSSVDPNESNYSKLVAQGVSPEDAKRIVANTTASDGESVKQQDKVDAILKQNMSDDKTYAAMGAVLNESTYDALTEARAAGISCRVFMEFRSKAENMKADKDPNDPEKTIAGSKKEKVVELIDSLQLTTEQKDVLYLMYYAESGLYDTPWH